MTSTVAPTPRTVAALPRVGGTRLSFEHGEAGQADQAGHARERTGDAQGIVAVHAADPEGAEGQPQDRAHPDVHLARSRDALDPLELRGAAPRRDQERVPD